MDKRRVQLDVDSDVTYPRYRPPAWLDDLREEVIDLKDESRSRSELDLDYEEPLSRNSATESCETMLAGISAPRKPVSGVAKVRTPSLNGTTAQVCLVLS